MSQAVEARAQTEESLDRRPSGRKRISDRARAERKLGWMLCAPAAFVMLLVAGWPILYAIYLSLERYDLRFPGQHTFVGIDNYATVVTSSFWWHAFWVTSFITVVSVTFELVLGMAVALLMHRTIYTRGLVRTAVLVPYGIVTVVAAYSWNYAWTPGTGYLADLLGSHAAPLTDQWTALAIIILAEVWKTTPFMALLLLAGLSLVDDSLLRAARVDGASAWQRFTKVTLPLMKPAILVALLFRTLDAFRIFDNIFILTNGAHGTESVSILDYDNLTIALNLGIGSAISVLIFIAVALIAFLFIKGFGTAAPGQEVK